MEEILHQLISSLSHYLLRGGARLPSTVWNQMLHLNNILRWFFFAQWIWAKHQGLYRLTMYIYDYIQTKIENCNTDFFSTGKCETNAYVSDHTCFVCFVCKEKRLIVVVFMFAPFAWIRAHPRFVTGHGSVFGFGPRCFQIRRTRAWSIWFIYFKTM